MGMTMSVWRVMVLMLYCLSGRARVLQESDTITVFANSGSGEQVGYEIPLSDWRRNDGIYSYMRGICTWHLQSENIGECIMHCMELAYEKFGSDDLDMSITPRETLKLDNLDKLVPQIVKAGYVDKIASDAYLGLLIRCLTGTVFPDQLEAMDQKSFEKVTSNLHSRSNGLDWPVLGYTMAGHYRTEVLRAMLEIVIADGVVGGFLEAGVWRGGQSVFARALLNWYGEHSRHVYVCDSFQGLPPPSVEALDVSWWSEVSYLAVPYAEVKKAFDNVGVPQNNVVFVEGYFRDSLPVLRREKTNLRLAVLRLDGDMYESYFDCLFNLYDTLTVSGFLFVDDYGIEVARRAVTDFRVMHGITDELFLTRDGAGAYWRKSKDVALNMTHYHDMMMIEM